VVIESIREFNRAVRFVPYEIHTASGESYEVPHPDFISISPKGSFVIVIDAKECPHHLNALLIDRSSSQRPETPQSSEAFLSIDSARSAARLSGWNSKSFDLVFDLVCESRRAGAVYNAVIERERERDNFCAFVFVFVGN
jgi:hypothetical protein